MKSSLLNNSNLSKLVIRTATADSSKFKGCKITQDMACLTIERFCNDCGGFFCEIGANSVWFSQNRLINQTQFVCPGSKERIECKDGQTRW